MIPYGENRQSYNIVLVNNDFASLRHFEHQAEIYTFDCNVYYNRESFIMGNNARIIVSPKLFIHGEIAPLSIIKDAEIVVITRNEENIPGTVQKYIFLII